MKKGKVIEIIPINTKKIVKLLIGNLKCVINELATDKNRVKGVSKINNMIVFSI